MEELYYCTLCDDQITDNLIKPCNCHLRYHSYCLRHIYKNGSEDIMSNQCDICKFQYNITFINCFSKLQCSLYSLLNNTLKINYFIGSVIVTVECIYSKHYENWYYNISFFSLYYILILRSLITFTYIQYSLKYNLKKLILYELLPISILPFLYNYNTYWLNSIIILITTYLLLTIKKELFVLSSKYPYCNIISKV